MKEKMEMLILYLSLGEEARRVEVLMSLHPSPSSLQPRHSTYLQTIFQ